MSQEFRSYSDLSQGAGVNVFLTGTLFPVVPTNKRKKNKRLKGDLFTLKNENNIEEHRPSTNSKTLTPNTIPELTFSKQLKLR
jgi:hypothetical protein